MADNIFNEKNISKFQSAYNSRRTEIIDNLFLHSFPSPYDTKKNQSLIKKVDISSKKIIQLLENQNFIKSLQKLEKIKMINMYTQLVISSLWRGEDSELEDKFIIDIAQEFNSLNFEEQIKELNRAYTAFLNKNVITSNLIENGRVKWKEIQSALGGTYIKGINKKGKEYDKRVLGEKEKYWFDMWYNIFTENKGKINIDRNIILTTEQINNLKTNFLKFQEDLEKEIQKNQKEEGDYLKAEMLSIIQNYTLGRGLNLINSFYQRSKERSDKTKFEDIRNIISMATNNMQLSKKIKTTSQPKNIHYTYNEIMGSFSSSIGASNYRGFIAEELVADAFSKVHFVLKQSKTGYIWRSVQEGGKTDTRGKMQKIDNSFYIPYLIEINDNKQGQEISINYQPKNTIKIGLSLKDYRDDNVSIHSAGNLDTIRTYLSQTATDTTDVELNDAVKEYLSKLTTQEIKYYIINEGEPNRVKSSKKEGFFKNLQEQLSNLGPVFALSRITSNNDLNAVDFLVINQTIIPGSLLFTAIRETVRYNTSISPSEYPVGDYTPIQTTSNSLYSDELLQDLKNRNENIYFKTTFSFHLRKQFKNLLMKKVQEIKEVNNG